MDNRLLLKESSTSVFQLYFHLLKILKALPLYMLLLSSISNKDVLFIFSANKAAAEEVPQWYLWSRKLWRMSIDSIQAPISTTSAQIESS